MLHFFFFSGSASYQKGGSLGKWVKLLLIRCILDFLNLQLNISKIPGAKEEIRIWTIAQK